MAESLLTRVAALLCCTLMASSVLGESRSLPQEQRVKQEIVAQSIAAYPGRCPCPYNVTRNGSSCGARSAWSRKGGYAPICYEDEVTSEMVKRHPQRSQQDTRVARQETPPQ
jgi:hypothetical protein